MLAIFTWLTHWRTPINACRSPCGVKRTKNHLTDCCYCFTKIDGHNSGSKRAIVCHIILSALRPVEHDDCLCQFLSNLNNRPCMKKTESESPQKTNLDLHVPMWIPIFRNELYLILYPQSELNDPVIHLNISKIQAELLASLLQGWNLLQQGVKVSYRKGQQSPSSFLFKNDELVYCNDVEGLLQRAGMFTLP